MAPIDHAQIDQRVQVGKETVRGTAVAALISLPTAQIMLKGEGTNKDIFPSGAMFPSASRPGKRWGSGTYEGDASYTELTYFLDAFFGYVTASTVGTGGKRRVWSVPRRGVPTPMPLTIQQGDTVRAKEMAGAVLTAFTFKNDPDDVSFSGDILGGKPNRTAALSTNTKWHSVLAGTDATTTFAFSTAGALGVAGPTAALTLAATDQSAAIQTALEALSTIGAGNVRVTRTTNHAYDIEGIGSLAQLTFAATDLTGTATLGSSPANTITRTGTGAAAVEVPLILVDPNDVTITLATVAYADLGTNTALPRAAEFTLDITDLRAAFFMIGNNTAGYTGIVGKRPGANITLTLGADNEGLDLLTAVEAGTTLWLRWQATGDEYESGNPYRLTIDLALQCSKVPEDTDKEELALLKYEFVPIWDSVNSLSCVITLDNMLTF